MKVLLTSSNTLEFPSVQRGHAGNGFLQEGYCSEESEILLKSCPPLPRRESAPWTLISLPSEFPSLWFFPFIWSTEKNNSTVIQKCLFDADVSVVTQMSLSLSFAATTFPIPHLSIHSLAVSKVRSETAQPWKYGTGFFRCSSTWTNSPWQHLNPFFRLVSYLSYYKYSQNREFGPNTAKYLQSLYVWGSGSISRCLKIF